MAVRLATCSVTLATVGRHLSLSGMSYHVAMAIATGDIDVTTDVILLCALSLVTILLQ